MNEKSKQRDGESNVDYFLRLQDEGWSVVGSNRNEEDGMTTFYFKKRTYNCHLKQYEMAQDVKME